MCRLVAYAGEPLTLDTLMFGGSHPLFRQSWAPRELLAGSVNADGYGVGWYVRGQAIRHRRVGPVWHDPDLERLLGSIRAAPAVALLRNTTPGIPVDLSGTAPLLHEHWLFGLNGYIQDFRRRAMRHTLSLLPDDLFGAVKGTSDTEALFLLAVARAREGMSLGEALADVAETALGLARQLGVEAQLNMVLCDGDTFALTRTGNKEKTNSLYVAEGANLAPGGTLVASEALDDDEAWRAVPPHSLVEVTRNGAIQITSLGR